jgi:hypothetical protein
VHEHLRVPQLGQIQPADLRRPGAASIDRVHRARGARGGLGECEHDAAASLDGIGLVDAGFLDVGLRDLATRAARQHHRQGRVARAALLNDCQRTGMLKHLRVLVGAQLGTAAHRCEARLGRLLAGALALRGVGRPRRHEQDRRQHQCGDRQP